MAVVVVDARVAGRWILPDERGRDSDAAALWRRLLDSIDMGHAPPHVHDEVFSLRFQAHRNVRRPLRPNREGALGLLADKPGLPVQNAAPPITIPMPLTWASSTAWGAKAWTWHTLPLRTSWE